MHVRDINFGSGVFLRELDLNMGDMASIGKMVFDMYIRTMDCFKGDGVRFKI